MSVKATEKEMKDAMEAAQLRASSEQIRADRAEADLKTTKAELDKSQGALESVRVKLTNLEQLRADEKPEEMQAVLAGQTQKIIALEKARTDELANYPLKLRQAVKDRVALESVAGVVLTNQRLDDMEDRQIMVAVVQKLHGHVIVEDKSMDYVRARFDAAVEGYRSGANAIEALRIASSENPERNDADDNKSPRDKMIERNQNAWKKAQ